MKQFFKMFFASMLGMVVASVIIVGLLIGLVAGIANKAVSSASSNKESVNIKDNSILKIDLSKTIHEQGEENSLSLLSSNESAEVGIYEIGKILKAAANDNKIKGVFIKLAPIRNNFATVQQIRMYLDEFKTSGKFIYAYGDNISQGSLYFGSVADSIFVNPAGSVELKGLSSSLSFYKNTLKKLEIEPEIFYAGKFKSATEPFREEKMSDANRQQIASLQRDMWSEMIDKIAKHANTDIDQIHSLAANASIQFPNDALQHQLVDAVLYWDEVEQILKKKLDIKATDDIAYTEMGDYYNGGMKTSESNDNRIAVIFAEGQIADGESTSDYQITDKNLTESIRKVAKDDKIKAVVLRVNSPGGSAKASEIIWRELTLLHKKKPIIVSMGDLAASGGYYISCVADSVFAMPSTITGSIGVFTMLFNSEKLLTNKLGITFDTEKNAPHADFPTATRKLTAQEAKIMQNSVDTIYSVFKKRVADARGLSMDYVDSIAQGRIWSGIQAKQLGLVHDLGNLDRAITSAAAIAKLDKYEVRTYPEKVDKLKSFLKKIQGNTASEQVLAKAIAEAISNENAKEILFIKDLASKNKKQLALMPMEIKIQ
jgi:protease-4